MFGSHKDKKYKIVGQDKNFDILSENLEGRSKSKKFKIEKDDKRTEFSSISFSWMAILSLLSLPKIFAYPMIFQNPQPQMPQFSPFLMQSQPEVHQMPISASPVGISFGFNHPGPLPSAPIPPMPFINPMNPGATPGNVPAPNIFPAIGLDPSFPPSSLSPAFLSGYTAALNNLAQRIASAYVIKETTEMLKNIKSGNSLFPSMPQSQFPFSPQGISPFPSIQGMSPFMFPNYYSNNAIQKNPSDSDNDYPSKKRKSKKYSKRRSSKSKRKLVERSSSRTRSRNLKKNKRSRSREYD